MSERPSPNVLVQIWLDSRPSWSTKNTKASRSCGGAVVARAEGRKPPAPGQRVAFRVQSADVLAFNPATGARLAG